jgi:hypothetical protein
VNRSRENRTRIKTSDTAIFIPWFGQVEHLPSPRCGVPMDDGCTQPLSSDQKINLNTTVLFISSLSFFEESPTCGASHPYKFDHNETTRVREGIETHTRARVTQRHTHKSRNEHTTQHNKFIAQTSAQISKTMN